MIILGSIDVKKGAKIGAFVFAAVGTIFLFLSVALTALFISAEFSLVGSLVTLILGPLIYYLIGYVLSYLTILSYNWYVTRFGGIEIRLFKKIEDGTHLPATHVPTPKPGKYK